MQIISDRDLQQSLFANFFAVVFDAGQQTIVGKIEPYETEKLAGEQEGLIQAVSTAIAVGIIVPVLVSLFAIFFMGVLSRQVNHSVSALLMGAGGCGARQSAHTCKSNWSR